MKRKIHRFSSRFGLLEKVTIREVPMLITAVDFMPGRIRYCLEWIANGAHHEQWLGEQELIAFMEMKP